MSQYSLGAEAPAIREVDKIHVIMKLKPSFKYKYIKYGMVMNLQKWKKKMKHDDPALEKQKKKTKESNNHTT